ncbi:hypothetical protein [Gordonia alkanivorans]|uniref:hypothetical protein n=1 Tax=Gordonia alkanivorans TaxID=84096 RepID=UPI0024B75CA7|nr:hypothetical protein [Gordonia alkanivorans]MDJ0010095.1 hypothetical protein [Gordonia alkanivorans]MDJ0495715.1 hypothetical protein [Gordonia alkanivorans]
MGTVGYSWYDLKVMIEWGLPNDPTSALFRSLNPTDWMWATVEARLLAEIATQTSDVRFLTAASLMQDVPEDYWPSTYGPQIEKTPDSEDQRQVSKESTASAKSVADEIRASLV